jgi:long-chain acyl-CoA synthetase
LYQSLAALFTERLQKTPSKIALRYKENRSLYRDMIWQDFGNLVSEMAFGLASLGLEPKAPGAIMSNTSHLWIASDLAIITNGSVSIPIYPTSSISDIQHVLNNSEAEIIFVQTESLLNKLLAVIENVPSLKKIILLTAPAKGRSLSDLNLKEDLASLVIGLEELQELGRTLKDKEPNLIDERINGINSEEIATIIYTSGTTGTPKGVILTHGNILNVLNDLPETIPVTEDDTFLSFLPLSHVFERICGEFYWLLNGTVCAFAEGVEHVGKNMQEVKPSVMLVVPRILDKIYSKVRSGIDGASGRARNLIDWSLQQGKQVFEHRISDKPIRLGLQAKHYLAEKLVLSKLRERIGSRLKLIISGGAPATIEVIEFFNAIGITAMEGYGLTETTAPTNVNRVQKVKPGSVGPALAGVSVKIADDGEILVSGPTVFKGYYRDSELTKSVFTGAWFHTGDIGEIDQDGYLKITDRKKDIIVNSAGKNIAPQKIEAILKTIPLVVQAIVFGNRRKTLVSILTLDEQATIDLAHENNWSFTDYHELIKLPALKKYLKAEIEKRSHELADYEQVRNFHILNSELSVENGELTATMKIKRSIVEAKYKDILEKLYKDESLLVSSKQ